MVFGLALIAPANITNWSPACDCKRLRQFDQ